MGYFKVVNRENIDINAEIEKYSTTRVLISSGLNRGVMQSSQENL